MGRGVRTNSASAPFWQKQLVEMFPMMVSDSDWEKYLLSLPCRSFPTELRLRHFKSPHCISTGFPSRTLQLSFCHHSFGDFQPSFGSLSSLLSFNRQPHAFFGVIFNDPLTGPGGREADLNHDTATAMYYRRYEVLLVKRDVCFFVKHVSCCCD